MSDTSTEAIAVSRGSRGIENVFSICSHRNTMRIDEHAIAEAILTAPGWARVGLTAPAERLREEAALELARAVLGGAVPTHSPDQLSLFT